MTVSDEIQSQLNQLVRESNLPTPRLENRTFITNIPNEFSGLPEYQVQSYYGMVYEDLGEGINFLVMDHSKAYLPIHQEPSFYLGIRRFGNILNDMLQLKLKAYSVEEDQSFKEINFPTNELDWPRGLLAKKYFPKNNN